MEQMSTLRIFIVSNRYIISLFFHKFLAFLFVNITTIFQYQVSNKRVNNLFHLFLGETSIMYAASRGHSQIVQLLTKKGADVHGLQFGKYFV